MDTRRDVQMCQLQILKAVAKVCDDHGIAYSLTGGSLIGAIRHKGFIPWDDDIDICMTAEDYKRFCKIGQACLGRDFFVQNWQTEKEFSELWTQVRMNNTTSMPIKYKNWNIHFGIHIDIFPVIGLYDDERRRQKQYEWFRICKSMIVKDFMRAVGETAHGKQVLINHIPRWIRRMICRHYEKKLMISPTGTKTASELWLGLDNQYSSRLYDEYVTVDFEDMKAQAIKEYDAYLSATYGDYMTPPPEEERRGHTGEVLEGIKDTHKSYTYYKTHDVAGLKDDA